MEEKQSDDQARSEQCVHVGRRGNRTHLLLLLMLSSVVLDLWQQLYSQSLALAYKPLPVQKLSRHSSREHNKGLLPSWYHRLDVDMYISNMRGQALLQRKQQRRQHRQLSLKARSHDLDHEAEFEENFNDDERDDEEMEVIEGGKKFHLSKNDQEWMFFDTAKINVKGGDGGDGCMAMRREFRLEFGGPCGGNGGHGGNVYIECDEGLNTLSMLRRRVHHKAKDGTNGLGKSKHGTRGVNTIIPVPPGTIIRDEDGILAGEVNHHGQRLMVAKGGKGGRGNEHFRTARMNTPAFRELGEEGKSRWINVELKLVADVGLIGVPNAGKSTLLSACSNAKPKIADYPFTTVVPNLGVCDIDGRIFDKGKGLVIADIPGLLEGAHDGTGLGVSFLRHIQRCRALVHVVDVSSKDPIGDFKAINQELELFNPKLLEKPQVVAINKIDVEDRELCEEVLKEIRNRCNHTRIMMISAVTGENVQEMMIRVRKLVESLPVQSDFELYMQEEERVTFDEDIDDGFEILTDPNFPGQFRVIGSRIEKVVETTSWDYYEAVQRFQRIMEAQGINEALKQEGAEEGDLVMIGEWDFNYFERRNLWVQELGLESVNPRKRPVKYDD